MLTKSREIFTLFEGLLGRSEQHKYIVDNIEWAKAVANRMAMKLPKHISIEDLYSAAKEGLVVAAGNFDPDKGFEFKTYAEHKIKSKILDWLREQDFYSRGQRKDKTDHEKAINRLSQELGREPDPEEIAKEMGFSNIDDYYKFLDDIQDELPPGAGMGQTEEPDVFDLHNTGVSRDKLIKSINSLPDEEKMVMSLLYKDYSSEEIAQQMGLTAGRISQIRSDGLKSLKKKLKVEEFTKLEDLSLAGKILALMT